MAKTAPGTYTKGGVNCTMDAPFGKTPSASKGNGMKAPFNQARSGGEPNVTMYRNPTGTPGGANAGTVAPSQQGQKRTGTKEYPQGGGSMRDGKSSGRP